jgi:hypothetical protein
MVARPWRDEPIPPWPPRARAEGREPRRSSRQLIVSWRVLARPVEGPWGGGLAALFNRAAGSETFPQVQHVRGEPIPATSSRILSLRG